MIFRIVTKSIVYFYTFAQIKLSNIFYEKIHAFHDAWHQYNRLGTNG